MPRLKGHRMRRAPIKRKEMTEHNAEMKAILEKLTLTSYQDSDPRTDKAMLAQQIEDTIACTHQVYQQMNSELQKQQHAMKKLSDHNTHLQNKIQDLEQQLDQANASLIFTKDDSWCKPLDYSEDEEQYNGSQINDSSAAAATHVSPSLMSVQPISGGEELSQTNEKKDDVWEEIKAESDGGVVRSDPVLQIAVTTSAAGVKGMTNGQAANKSQSVIVEYENSNPNIRWNNEVELSQMSLETRVPQTVPDSDIIDFSDAPQALPSQPSSSCDLDIMDLDQLKKEKLKMQIKVLRLQEEYYAQKLKELVK